MSPTLEAPQNQSSPKRAPLYIAAVVLSLLFVAAGYFVYHLPRSSVVMLPSRPFAPEGKIYLTLSPTGSSYTGVYVFDLASRTLAKVLGKDNSASITAHVLASSSLLLSSNISLDPTKAYLSPLQIFNLSEKGELKQITNTPATFKRHPSYSSALNLYVYGGKGGATTLGVNPNEFNIYTYKDGKEKLLTNGALPTLTPDGKSVVALRQDGLYLISLTSTTTQKIWGLDHGGSALNLQFTISPSGKYIAWSIPNDGYIYLMTVTSWAPFEGEITSQIETHAFWPVFSPNEEYLAYEQVDWTSPKPTNQKLVVFDLKAPKNVVVQDLKDFDQERMFVTAWK